MKTNLDGMYKTDPEMEKGGIWFDISDTTGFLVKRFGGFNSVSVKAMMAKYYKPFSRQIDGGTMDPKKEKEITAKVFVESCVLDWKGVEVDGKELKFSKEEAIKLFLSLPELLDSLVSYASDYKNYREDLGNS